MSFDEKKFRQKADLELSTRNGGNLIKKSIKIPQNQITIFIGLGGLGCKAVNAIKGTAEQKLDNPDRRFYLVIDTATNDLNDISVASTNDLENNGNRDDNANHGWMTEKEKCPLFNAPKPYTVSTLPHDIDDWVDRAAMDEEIISGEGAHAIRQIGRIMLFSKGNYSVVFGKIKEIIGKAVSQKAALPAEYQHGRIKVYIIAGISGGTGSGTVVDISFMVRKAIKSFGMPSFQVEGVVFTPDVQEADPGMEDADRIKLKHNFYAAMKEIDYFYNNKARKKKYKCPIKGDEDSAYEFDIFDSCTIVSRFSKGIVMAPNSDGIINKIANAITYEISSTSAADIGTVNVKPQPLSSFMDNQPSRVASWLKTPTGKGMQIPEWAPPLYSTFGYGSFYIPRDELLAYCANNLVRALMNQWNKNIFDEKDTRKFMKKYGIDTLQSFAAKLFELAGCTKLFDVPRNMKPVDPSGPYFGLVKNCISYLDEMHQTATSEGQEMNVKQIIRDAAHQTEGTIVTPICTYFDKAFLNQLPKTGPAHAVRLLASIDVSNPGVLKNLETMLSQVTEVADQWEASLKLTYNSLCKLGEQYESQKGVDKDELDTYTARCRDYGEQLLQAKILRYAKTALEDVYIKLNTKNNELFNIYTVSLQYLVEMLEKDSAYVVNPRRCREGNNTVFSFDMANFEEGDQMTAKFRTLFDGLVDSMDINAHAQNFVDNVFAQIKNKVNANIKSGEEFDEDTVLDIIRDYFAKEFPLWTSDVIERFCVIAYSQLDITPQDLTNIWNDQTKKAAMDVALASTANTINLQLQNTSGSLLTLFDSSKDVEQFSGYTALLALPQTSNINAKISGCTAINSSWSEFVLFKRRGGIPLCLINGLEEWQKVYVESNNPGLHLDEVGDNWKINVPEPYGYNIRQLSGKYLNSGRDQTEYEKNIMSNILKLGVRAKELGLLQSAVDDIEQDSSPDEHNKQKVVVNYYKLIYDFVQPIDPKKDKEVIFKQIREQLQSAVNNGENMGLLQAFNAAGYQACVPIEIRWTFTQSQFAGMMIDCTSFGDDVVFGNFVTLIRSNFEWYKMLRDAVNLFESLNSIYLDAMNEINDEKHFKDSMSELLDAISVNRFVPFYNNGIMSGFEIKISDDSTQNIRFINEGFKKVDTYFILYLAYIEKFLKLDRNIEENLKRIISIEQNTDNSKQLYRASRENVDWFISEIKKVIEDKDLLAHYSESLRNEKLADLIKYSKFDYSLPVSSNKNTDIAIVADNLIVFYRELRKLLEENRISDSTPYIDEVQHEKHNDVDSNVAPVLQQHIIQHQNEWVCSKCNNKYPNNVTECPVDGTAKPQAMGGSWTCPSCGNKYPATLQSCPVDGTAKPTANGGPWTCPNCGNKYPATLQSCPVDGTAKPTADDGPWTCPSCGNKYPATLLSCPIDGASKQ